MTNILKNLRKILNMMIIKVSSPKILFQSKVRRAITYSILKLEIIFGEYNKTYAELYSPNKK